MAQGFTGTFDPSIDHATSHEDGGADAIKIGTMTVPTASLSVYSDYSVVVSDSYTLNSGIVLTIESNGRLAII